MKKLILLLLLSVLFVLFGFRLDASALAVDADCTPVEAVYARGSGERTQTGWVRHFGEGLDERLRPAGISIHLYELGTDVYDNASYPAVEVGNVFNGNATGAAISAGKSFDYGNSVAAGKIELKRYLTLRLERCPTARVVIGGYSQGAQVVREAVSELPENITKNIDFLALFGDPRLHLPEGEGFFPPACRGKDFSAWRRVVENCETDNGSLGAQKPFLSSVLASKTGLWCYDHDFVCGSSKNPFDTGGHMRYGNEGQAIDLAVQEAANKLKTRFVNEQAAKIDLAYRLGYGFNGEDVAFVIDISKSMEERLPAIKQLVNTTAAKLKEKNGRFANVIYYWPDDEPSGVVYLPHVGFIEFERDYSDALMYFNRVDTTPYNKQAPTLSALIDALDHLKWRPGAMKSILLFTDEPQIASPDYFGRTLSYVINRTVEIDPVNIFPIVPAEVQGAYQELADKTQGSVTVDDGNTLQAGNKAYEKTVNRPVVLFKNLTYIAKPNEEITFDASSSYAIGTTTAKFEWDFNGDNIFDAVTTEPKISHVYGSEFDGLVQLKVTTVAQTVANGTAEVKIRTSQVQESSPAPQGLNVVNASDNTKATLTWDAPNDNVSTKWVISSNGVPLGTIDRSKTMIEIKDLDRMKDVVLGVAGMSATGLIGEYSSVTLTKAAPNVPICNTSNALTDAICRFANQLQAQIDAQQRWLRMMLGR